MKTVEELKQYFDTTLQPDLIDVENSRRAIVTKVFSIGILMAIILVALCYFIIVTELHTGFIILFCILIPTLTAIFIRDTMANRDFYTRFKMRVIDKIVKFIDPSFRYNSSRYIETHEFLESKLFSQLPKRYKGDDFAEGKIDNNILLHFSELNVEYKTAQPNQKVKYHTLFKGLFFIAQPDNSINNKLVQAETIIIPLSENSGLNTQGNKITIDNPDFNKVFQVYGTNEAETKAIIDADLQKLLLEYKATTASNIYCSFIRGKVYIGITHIKDLFEPKIFQTLINFDIIKEYYDDLIKAITIVQKINKQAYTA
jgi:catechol 2,3-dioxygenase-like lactoylglutathione lyase family enzyme